MVEKIKCISSDISDIKDILSDQVKQNKQLEKRVKTVEDRTELDKTLKDMMDKLSEMIKGYQKTSQVQCKGKGLDSVEVEPDEGSSAQKTAADIYDNLDPKFVNSDLVTPVVSTKKADSLCPAPKKKKVTYFSIQCCIDFVIYMVSFIFFIE